MHVHPQQVLELTTARGLPLGRLIVEQFLNGLLLAQFAPGPEYGEVKPLFDEFEDAVDQQMFSLAEETGAAIGALGLCLRSADGRECLVVHDVQIMNGHDLSCRLSALPATAPAPGSE